MSVTLTVTNAGRAAIVNAQNTGTNAVTITQVGLSPTAITPSATATSLDGEIKRIATVSGEVVADDVIHLTMNDDSAGVYTLKSFALYLSDGTLFALYGQADAIIEKVAASIAMLSVDVVFADIAATSITFGDANFVNPPATTERQGVVEMATAAETAAGVDALRAISPAALKAALMQLLTGMDGAGSGLDADLLDGQQGAYYANIPARLGFTPANLAGDTFGGRIGRDANYYVDLQTGDPIINFDAHDYLRFGRTSDTLSLVIGSTLLAYCGPDGYLWARAGFSVNGQAVWHAGNDGSGSGLDADLLDGQQGSYYLSAATYTPANVLAKLVTVDGAGSGLDADLLDGQQGTYYADIPARLGYTPANKAGDTFSGLITVRSTGNGTGFRMLNTTGGRDYRWVQKDNGYCYLTDETTGAERLGISPSGDFQHSGNKVWDAGVDGSGSGLDADLLDGLDSSAFARATGQTFTGDISVQKSGNANLFLTSAGVATANIVMQADGNFACYRDGAVVFNQASKSAPLNFNVPINIQGSLGWSAGNDGAGSGLDADLLDGLQSTDFLRQLAGSIASNGYMTLNNGLLLQWGRWTSSASAGNPVNVTFPISFSAEPHTLLLLPVVTDTATISAWSSDGITGSYFPGRCSRASVGCRFLAIGPV